MNDNHGHEHKYLLSIDGFEPATISCIDTATLPLSYAIKHPENVRHQPFLLQLSYLF